MKKQVEIVQMINVTVDESKFTEAFYKEFNRYFFDFGTDIEKHIEHLAQMYARGVVHEFTEFIEGYGPVKDMGIEFEEVDVSINHVGDPV